MTYRRAQTKSIRLTQAHYPCLPTPPVRQLLSSHSPPGPGHTQQGMHLHRCLHSIRNHANAADPPIDLAHAPPPNHFSLDLHRSPMPSSLPQCSHGYL